MAKTKFEILTLDLLSVSWRPAYVDRVSVEPQMVNMDSIMFKLHILRFYN
jgi:hypothetical protein